MGLLDNVNAGVQSGMQSPLFNLGMGLIGGAQPFANPGQQMMGAAAATQMEQARQQQLALTQMRMRMFGSVLGQLMGKPQGAPQGAVPQAPAQGMTASAPVGGPFSAMPPAATAAAPYGAPTPDQIGSVPIAGMSPQQLQALGFLNGQDPTAIAQKIRAQQLQIEQQQFGPTIAKLETAMKAQSPTQYVKSDPRLKATWDQLAPSLGFDPMKDFKDANVRTMLAFARNRIAGALQEPTIAPPVQMSQVAGPLNSLYNRDPVTNALTQVRAEEQLKPIVGDNGHVSYLGASQAAGKTPFNPETYINPQTTGNVADLIAHYQFPADRLAYMLRTQQGQAILAQVKQINPTFDASTYTVKQKARQGFATGKQGDIVRSLSVATNHLDQLADAAHALAQNNVPALNHVVNAFSTRIGNPGVTSFEAMKEIVGDEVVKAVVGTSGAESDRQAIKDAFKAANSPQQLEGVIQKYEGLMGGQLSGLRRQYERATGLTDFNSFVSDLAQQKLSGASASGPPVLTATGPGGKKLYLRDGKWVEK